jgi:surface protein
VERGVTLAALMVMLTRRERITTFVAMRPLRLTAVRLPYVRLLEGPVFLYGDCQRMFEHNRAPALRLDTVDTRAVTSRARMFQDSTFNGDLRSWDTTNTTNMHAMFQHARSFDHVLPQWDTTNVTDTAFMFAGVIAFNQSLPAWDTANVTDMSSMFYCATSFDKVLPTWDTGRVTSMDGARHLHVAYV